MQRFDSYLFKNLTIAIVFITFVLTAVVFLTQSLRFLELVVESGASSLSFWLMTSLALPRFFEIIVPLAAMAGTIFVYNRMSMDSEMVAIRSIGYSPYQIGRSALMLSLVLALFLYAISMFIAPSALSNMNKMRQVIKSQFSNVLFKEGVFNRVGNGLTLYIKEKNSAGEMAGLMIHDNRPENPNPSTVLAKRGIVLNDDGELQVVVYEGSRQEYDSTRKVLQRLDFERYIIDLPQSEDIRERWREPNERTIVELFNPDRTNERDMESIRDFQVEVHKRLTNPLLAIAFTLIALTTLLIGPVDRRGQGRRIVLAIVLSIIIQGGYISIYNIARNSDVGIVLMYVIPLLPIIIGGFLLSGASEALRRQILYKDDIAKSKA